jgi:lipoprotein-anchoring transpeptidase ErfK/SrfK
LSKYNWLCFVTILVAITMIPFSPAAGEEEEVYLLINKKTNRLIVLLNDYPIYVFPVATGRSDLTPEGEFRIVTKVVKPYYLPKKIAGGDPANPLGTRWIGLSLGNGYKYGIHGTNRPSLIGRSVSSGCIRMRNKDVEFIYRHIPLRTRVVIVSGVKNPSPSE